MSRLPAVHQASTNNRPASLAACAVLASLLNVGAIGLATGGSAPRTTVTATTSEHPRRMAMVLVAGLDASLEPDSTARDTRSAVKSNDSPRPHHRLPASLPTARPALAATEHASQQVLFYPFSEVDRPAYPESDWNLNIDLLDQIGVQRLVFEVLVNDRGEVVGCAVLEPSSLADEVKRDLETRLSETPLLPAVRAGQLVASVRRIELLVAFALPESSANPSARHP